jgi:predicted DNA binding CopG/RHH family protein
MSERRPRTATANSEDAELRFWDEHDPTEFDEGPADVVVRLKRRPKKVVTFRLDQELYDQLREVAVTHGVPYQRLMRELLRHSLRSIRKRPVAQRLAQAAAPRPDPAP